MRKLNTCLTLVVGTLAALAVLTAAPARAQAAHGGERGFGLGVAQNLAGIGGMTFVYDASSFHVVGLLGLQTVNRDAPANDSRAFSLGGEFLFHVSTTASSDFSLGGGLTILTLDNEPGDGDVTNIDLEGLAQIRAFIVPNVALSASFGLIIVTTNDVAITDNGVVESGGKNSIGLGGQIVGDFGLTYFF